MRPLQTPLCTLEPQVAAHAAAMFDVLSDPSIYEFEGTPPPSVEALARGYRRSESRRSPDGSEQLLNWVVRMPDGELAGYVQATVTPTGTSCIGYEFSSRFWRQGIASASVAAVMDELRAAYRVDTVVAVLKRANVRSMGLLRKLGFTPATPRQCAPYGPAPDEVVLLHVR